MIVKQPSTIIYPSRDGKPIADNTLQFQWITTIKGGLEVVFRDDPNVFIAGDLLWYPVQGEPSICTAPDVLVVFGRPKRHRESYLQWQEDNIPPQVVFEVLSPSNNVEEMMDKLSYYDEHDVEEYYQFDPYKMRLQGWQRQGTVFRRIWNTHKGWISPRLKVQMEIRDEDLILTGPDGKRFLTYEELAEVSRRAEAEVMLERSRAEEAMKQAEVERSRAEGLAKQLQELREKLRSQGIDPDTI